MGYFLERILFTDGVGSFPWRLSCATVITGPHVASRFLPSPEHLSTSLMLTWPINSPYLSLGIFEQTNIIRYAFLFKLHFMWPLRNWQTDECHGNQGILYFYFLNILYIWLYTYVLCIGSCSPFYSSKNPKGTLCCTVVSKLWLFVLLVADFFSFFFELTSAEIDLVYLQCMVFYVYLNINSFEGYSCRILCIVTVVRGIPVEYYAS